MSDLIDISMINMLIPYCHIWPSMEYGIAILSKIKKVKNEYGIWMSYSILLNPYSILLLIPYF